MSSSGWDVGDYYSFGFSVDNGYFSDLTELQIGTRSSNTGPGFLELYYSGDGFTNSLGQIAHQGTSFSNTVFDLSGLTGLTGVVEFRLRMDSTVNANGGTVAATGTNRITNYFFDNVDTGGFRVLGTVSAIPEPSALLLVGSIIGAGALRRRRS
jgi:hypothetical protein